MVSDQRRPWTPAKPEESQKRCRPFKKEYALFLKIQKKCFFFHPMTSTVLRREGVSDSKRLKTTPFILLLFEPECQYTR
uniref:SFRICE_029102 n=1 Tax=Spodoptera frugiperda TaxID=7108 RepID=A0A2H1WUF2_SPOFR